MARYDYRVVSVSVPTGSNFVFALGANPMRVSLTAVAVGGSQIYIGDRSTNNFEGCWLAYFNSRCAVATVRDFGPIVQREIWVNHTSGGTLTVNVTEIFKISGCN